MISDLRSSSLDWQWTDTSPHPIVGAKPVDILTKQDTVAIIQKYLKVFVRHEFIQETTDKNPLQVDPAPWKQNPFHYKNFFLCFSLKATTAPDVLSQECGQSKS